MHAKKLLYVSFTSVIGLISLAACQVAAKTYPSIPQETVPVVSPTPTLPITAVPVVVESVSTPTAEPTLSSEQQAQLIMEQFVNEPLYNQFIQENHIPEQDATAFYNEYPGVDGESFAVVTMKVDPNSLSEEKKALNIPKRDYLVVKTEDGRIEFILLPANLQLEAFSKSAVEFTLSREYRKGIEEYCLEMGIVSEAVSVVDVVINTYGQANHFLVASVDRSTLTDEQIMYSHLYQPKPLFLAIENAEAQQEFKLLGLDNLGCLLNKRIATTGTYWDSGSPYEKVVVDNFNTIVTENDLNWEKIQQSNGPLKASRISHTNRLAEIDNKSFSVVGNSLVDSIPEWALSNNPEITKQNIRNHIKEMFEKFPIINEWVVMKEFGWGPDPLIAQLGSNYYLEVYQMARDVAKELGRESEIRLLYGDNNNHTVDSPAYSNTIKIVNALKDKNLIDGVSLHLHVWGDKKLDSANIEEAVDSYGLPVYFQEIDINMKRVPVSRVDRLLQQADIEFEIITAGANSESVVLIGHWLIGDNKSWYEIEGHSPSDRFSKDADPTLFHDDLSPKPAYYAAIQALWNALNAQY